MVFNAKSASLTFLVRSNSNVPAMSFFSPVASTVTESTSALAYFSAASANFRQANPNTWANSRLSCAVISYSLYFVTELSVLEK